MVTEPVLAKPARQDDLLRKRLGFWSLLAAGLGSVVGSGWLLASMYAAQAAGPSALLAWVIGGVCMLLVGLVFAELGMVKPESGGLVRYPLYSNGRLAAAVVGWSMWVGYIGNPPTEAAGVLQYASAYLPGMYHGKSLTGLGILAAGGLMLVFVLINYFGVALFARTNNVVTAIKILVPTTTAIVLIATGFQSGNFGHQHGGLAPYGWSTALSTIATAGIVFAYTGFRNVVELSGEARNPRRNVPAALITTIVVCIVLYLALQTAFLGAVPGHLLGSGWHGVNLNSPFANLAMLLNLSWLYWILIADSMVSPSGSAIVYTAANARNSFGLAKNGFFPEWVMKVDPRWRVPVRALAINFVVGLAFLLPLPSWHAIIGVTGTLAVFTFAIGSVSVIAFRRCEVGDAGTRIGAMQFVAPAAFVVSSLVIFWASWPTLLKTIPIVAVGLVLYGLNYFRNRSSVGDFRAGIWLPVYLGAMYVLSVLGSFGGHHVLPAPWDSVTVGVVALGIYVWAVRSAVTHMSADPDRTAALRAEAAADRARQESAAG
ncbi:APC family permease [Streptacidiphilus fuscans]|uniref:APC family permease n=1 Tax=Streptacidiphilus fuscans TaxID=2789292 RepID=A0A931AXD9_9ACTN|nr:APC family permease [Streptacidiphilus fuscans]MBF9067139.1 APC family permease [Streptacidiphilus fuscans]